MCCERVQRCRTPAPNCPLGTTRALHDTRLQRDSCSDALTRCAGPPSACHNAHRIQSRDARGPRASSADSESRRTHQRTCVAVVRQPHCNRGLSRPWLFVCPALYLLQCACADRLACAGPACDGRAPRPDVATRACAHPRERATFAPGLGRCWQCQLHGIGARRIDGCRVCRAYRNGRK